MSRVATDRNLLHMFRSKQEPCVSPHCMAGVKCPRAHSVVDWCPPVWLNYKELKCFERWSDDVAFNVAFRNGFTFKQTATEWCLAASDYHNKKAREVVKAYLNHAGSSACDFVYGDDGKLLGSAPPVVAQPAPQPAPLHSVEACRLPVAEPVDPVEAELEIARQEYEKRCEQIRQRAVLLKEKQELLVKVNEWRERAKSFLSEDQLIM